MENRKRLWICTDDLRTDPNWAISDKHTFTPWRKVRPYVYGRTSHPSLKSGRVKETRPKRIEEEETKGKEEGEEGVKKVEEGEKEEEEEEEEEIETIEEEVHKWLFTNLSGKSAHTAVYDTLLN